MTKLEQMQAELSAKLMKATKSAKPGKVERRNVARGPGSDVTSDHWQSYVTETL